MYISVEIAEIFLWNCEMDFYESYHLLYYYSNKKINSLVSMYFIHIKKIFSQISIDSVFILIVRYFQSSNRDCRKLPTIKIPFTLEIFMDFLSMLIACGFWKKRKAFSEWWKRVKSAGGARQRWSWGACHSSSHSIADLDRYPWPFFLPPRCLYQYVVATLDFGWGET